MSSMTDSRKDDKLFEAKLKDMTALSEKRGAVYSRFLDGKEAAMAEKLLHGMGAYGSLLYGVFDNAERKMLCIHNEWSEPQPEDFPIVLLTFEWRKGISLTHRDFLGAFMSLGIKRETVGDIVVGNGMAQAAVTETAGELIESSVSKIGSVGVRCKRSRFAEKMEKIQNFKEIKAAVASLRLDAVAGAAMGLSRSRSAEIIKTAGSEVNFTERHDCSLSMKEGDVFSVRGHGKFLLSEVSGTTKKGRIHITILKYC